MANYPKCPKCGATGPVGADMPNCACILDREVTDKGTRFRRVLRWLGFKVHKGWHATHWSGCNKVCVGCGEERMEYCLKGTLGGYSWWETSCSGDGSCGPISELPPRFCL